MKTMFERLESSARKKGMSLSKVAESIGLARSAATRWKKGGGMSPGTANKVAEVLGVDMDWLISGEGPLKINGHNDVSEGSHAVHKEIMRYGVDLTESNDVPIVGTAEGGPEGHWDELGYPVGDGEEYVDAYSKDKNAYSLLVSGNSMAPRMRPGEAILVEPNHEAMPGDEVVVKTTDDQVMVKVFAQRTGNKIMLDSISDHHDRIMLTEDQIVFMHYVAGVFRASSIKQRKPVADQEIEFRDDSVFNF